MKKKLMLATTFVTGALMVTSLASVYAASVPNASSATSVPFTQLNTPVQAPSRNNLSISPESTSPPTSWWDLSNSPYYGSFSDVRTGIYTNYYFTPSSSGALYLNQSVSGTSGQDFVVELVDYTEGGAEVYYTIVPDNSSTNVTWTNLNPSHYYEVWWAPENSNDAIAGNFVVSQ